MLVDQRVRIVGYEPMANDCELVDQQDGPTRDLVCRICCFLAYPTSSAEQRINMEPVMEMPPTHQRNGNSGCPGGSTTALYSLVCATCYSNPPKPTPSIVPYYGNGTGLANSSFGGIGGSWFKSSRRGPAWSSSKSTSAADAGLE
ncbi:hypothetical protein Tsubulata_046106 [Turnera subulata]|uniref:Uncharacterized protein n=1 Tax=Turnera subulata TaxID=218843 RepID=A0A9Q0G3R8_9ROSI|nr:hypothetical protein Tsubulata_046106 [Turnera subulata]